MQLSQPALQWDITRGAHRLFACVCRLMAIDPVPVEKRAAPAGMTSTDEELVARSIGGDADSFNQLILRWERPIYALAYRTIGREEDARDVCQETFLRAFRALPGFRGQAQFSSWLYRIALNLCRDWVRRERRQPIAQAPEGVELLDLA